MVEGCRIEKSTKWKEKALTHIEETIQILGRRADGEGFVLRDTLEEFIEQLNEIGENIRDIVE